MPDSQPDLTDEQRIKIFTRMLRRIRFDSAYREECMSDPVKAKNNAQAIAQMEFGVRIPDRNIVAFLPGWGAAQHCHIFSVEPKAGSSGPPYNINNFLRCCYPEYDLSTLPTSETDIAK